MNNYAGQAYPIAGSVLLRLNPGRNCVIIQNLAID